MLGGAFRLEGNPMGHIRAELHRFRTGFWCCDACDRQIKQFELGALVDIPGAFFARFCAECIQRDEDIAVRLLLEEKAADIEREVQQWRDLACQLELPTASEWETRDSAEVDDVARAHAAAAAAGLLS
jgi:hypothetical protein